MSVHELLRAYALLGLPAGLLAGLALSLPAWRDGALGGYASFPRRALRLAHVAAVMLPVIAGVWCCLLRPDETPAVRAAARLWIAGGIALPLALAASAARRPLAPYVLPVPALALVAASVLFAVPFPGGQS